MGEEFHPFGIIQNLPVLPIQIACGAPRLLATRSPYRHRHTVSFHVLACEGMSGTPSILIVGAEASLHRTLAVALRAKGFEFETAASVEDAKRRLESGACEVVVVNLDVPGSFDLLRVRRGDGVPASVIAITGRPTVTNAVEAFRTGAIDVLTKPIRRDDLLAAVERAMERTRALHAVRGVQQLLGACARWFRDVEMLLMVPGAWRIPPAIRTALVEPREAGALDHVLVRCLGADEIGALTRREREVLLALAQGQRGRELARCLRISVNTCRTHTKAVLKKLGCHSQRELMDRLEGLPRARE